jgi:hypothetical protein
MKCPPVIILGMHRSGTAMVTQLLETAGLFVGDKLEGNLEAVFFLELNDWMLRQAHASWDNPHRFIFVDDGFRREMVKVMRHHLRGRKRRIFLGKKRFSEYKDIRDLDVRWGWKDPRNTFTLVIWKEIFPESKVVHVYRNPIDVAESLRQRELARPPFKKWMTSLNIKELLLKDIGYYADGSYFLKNLNEGMRLWKTYVERALRLSGEGLEVLHVKYEDILEAPKTKLLEILDFTGLEVDEDALSAATEKIDSTRRYAFLKSNELLECHQAIRNWEIMKTLGYSEIGLSV